MLHLNAIDKFIKEFLDEYDVLIIPIILVILVIAVIGLKIMDTHNQHESIDYKTGYSNGLKEMNESRYNIAKIVSNDYPLTVLVPPKVVYANGYIDGYKDGLLNQNDAALGYVPHN